MYISRDNVKKIWQIMKDMICKPKNNGNDFPHRLNINDQDIFNQNEISSKFNKYFVNVWIKTGI